MAAYEWKTTAFNGGTWTNAADWTPGGVPGAGDDVTFQIGSFYTVAGDDTVRSITVNGDGVTFTGSVSASGGGSLAGLVATNYASVTIGPDANVTASALAFDAGTQLSVTGLLIDTGIAAGLGGTADLVSVAGPNADFVAAAAVTLNALQIDDGATYAGDVILNDGGSVTLDTSATFGGGTLSLAKGGTLYVSNAGTETAGSLDLQKAIVLTSAGAGLQVADDPGVTLALSGGISGAGYVDVNSGIVSFTAPSTYTGGTIVDGATLTLVGGGAAGTGALFLNNALLATQADSTGGAGAETVVGTGGADTVNAAAGSLLVFGGSAASLSVQGGAGSTTVVGGTGILTATSGNGGGLFFAGSSGQDVLTAGFGQTTLVSAYGGTLIASQSTNGLAGTTGDVLVAAGGNTTLEGGAALGATTFFTSGTGNTLVETGAGTNTVVANGASDRIFAGAGTDNVFLGSGIAQLDFIDGFAGGTMNVTGFAAGDTLHLANYSAGEMQNALSNAVIAGGSTILTLSDSTHIVLYGFTALGGSTFT